MRWGLCPQTSRIAPLFANFWLRAWMSANKLKFISLNPKFLEVSTDLFRIIDVTTANSNENFIDCTGLFYILDIINVNLTENFRAVYNPDFRKVVRLRDVKVR